MSLAGNVLALAVKAKSFSNVTLPGLEADVNAWLAGHASPTIKSTTILVQFEFRFDGTNYWAVALYTEG